MSKPRRYRPHHSGTYPARAQAVVTDAYTNPDTRCWRCGLTLDESRAANPSYRGDVRWQAGHLDDSNPTSPLRAECSPCNERQGGRLGAQRRRGHAHDQAYKHW